MGFDPHSIPPTEFDRRIADLRDEVDAAKAELNRRETELAWWLQGRELFAQNGASPVGAQATKPTLRQAIKTVMREGTEDVWRVADLEIDLRARGWMPEGKNATQRVGDMLSQLTKRREVVRVDRGRYALPDRAPRVLLTEG